MKQVDEIFSIMRKRDNQLSQSDIDEIELLVAEIGHQIWLDYIEYYNEMLSLIVNDPLYSGDLSPSD